MNIKYWQFILRLLSSYKVCMFFMILTHVSWAAEISVIPYIYKILLNKIVNNNGSQLFSDIKLIIFSYFSVLFVVISLFRSYDYFVDVKMIPSLRQKIVNVSLGRLFRQAYHYHQSQLSADLANKINILTNRIPDLLVIIVCRFFSHSLAILIAIFTLSSVHKYFGLIMTVWASFLLSFSYIHSKIMAGNSDIWSESKIKLVEKMVDVLSNIRVVKLFVRRKFELEKLDQSLDKITYKERKYRIDCLIMFFTHTYSFLIVQGINIYFLIIEYQKSNITAGDFILVMTVTDTILGFLWTLAREFSEFIKIAAEVDQALSTILSPIEERNSECQPCSIKQGNIEISDVFFGYLNRDFLFKNLTVKISAGQKIGLVGYSGSGKTSFISLILNLYKINSGSIVIDGKDINSISEEDLLENISVISQESWLFNRSILDNIKYGKLNSTMEELIAASKKAYAHEFILGLENGYETLLGKDGTNLSGGQKQRIAIARAFLKDSPILILDEATSNLDLITESLIQNALKDLAKDKTCLIIAHRISTLLEMDRILVFDKGKIIQDGNHQNLIKQDGLYKILWEKQTSGFLPENL